MGGRHGRVRGLRALVATAAVAAGLAVVSAGPAGAAPANDAFAAAQEITGLAGQLTAENAGAGPNESGEPDHGKRGAFTLGAHSSVWYRWTAPTTELMTFDVTCGAAPCFLIPIVDVYTGSAVDALTVVPDATASYNSFTSQFDAVAGTTYRIAVAGRSFGGTGTFLLRWSNRPANDDFAAPQVIAGASGTLSASNVGATTEPGEPVPAVGQLSASVWFSWTPSTSATSNFAVGGSDAGVVLAVYQGDALGALTLVTDAPRIDGSTPMPRVSFAGTVGTTYRILVRGITPGGRGTINLAWSLGAPANDIGSSWTSFNDPIHAQIVREMVVFPGHSVVGSNVGATKETGERNHGGVPGGHSIWYSFQAHFDGASMTFDTVGSSFDTVLAIYEDGVLVAEDDDSAGGGASRASFTTRTRNTTGPTETLVEYLIAVDGKAGSTGPVRLNWYLTVPPNDDFADAEPITGVSGLVTTGQNLGASLEPGEPDHGFTTFPHTGRFTSHSVWYEWTAPANGAFAFSAAGSAGLGATFVPVIDVYTGTSLAALTSVATASTPSAFATVAFTAVEGSTYLIAVAGSDPFATGLVSLQWSDAFPFPQRLTSTAVVCASAATVGIAYGCTATVTDVDSSPSSDGWKGDPAGAATITLVGVNPPTWGCTLIPDGDPSTDSSTCTITQFPDAVPDPATGTAAAAYLETGSLLHSASSDPDGFGPITISARESSTQVVCAPSSVAATAPTTCTATVLEGAFDGGPLAGLQTHPAGTVTFSTSAPGAFASSTCLLVPQTIFSRPQSACSVTYTPAAAGTQRINASYATDRVHASSADPDGFTLQVDPKPQRATATHILCTPQRFTFGGTSTCTATVDDLQVGGTAAPPAGTVDLTSEVGGTFATCTLVAVDADSSSCDGTYAPTVYGFGSHHLGSSYPGSTDHASSSDANSSFVVLLRTSSTSVACEPLVIGVASTCTVSVTDTTGPADSGFAPFDVVNVSAEGPGTLSAPSCFLSNVASGSPLSQCTVDYTPSGVGDGTHTITADYPGPLNSIYLPSSGSVDLPLATDTEAPVTTAQVIAGTAGTPPWYRSPSVTVRLSATDTGGSGTASIAYTVDGGAPVVVASDTADVVVTGDALHALQFAATDGVGNTEASSSFAVGIDTVAPTLTVTGVVNGASYPVGSVPVAGCTAADNLAAAGSLAGPPTLTVTPLPAGALGGHTATCSITDKAGNPGSAAATYTVVAARVDEVSVRFTGVYSFAASGPAATGNIVEGTGTLAGAVTLGAGRSVAVDCTSVSASLNRASCSVTVGAPALGSAPVVTSGLAAYQRTALGGGRVRHDITMLGLRPVRIGPFTVPVPYLLQVTVVDAG